MSHLPWTRNMSGDVEWFSLSCENNHTYLTTRNMSGDGWVMMSHLIDDQSCSIFGLTLGDDVTLTLTTRNMSGDRWVMTSHLPWRPGICLEMGGWWCHTYLDDQEYVWRWVGDDVTLTLTTRNMSGDGWVMTSHLPWQPGICLEMGGWWRHTYLDNQEYVRRWVGDAEDGRAAEGWYVLVRNVSSQHLLDRFRSQIKVKILWDLQTIGKI